MKNKPETLYRIFDADEKVFLDSTTWRREKHPKKRGYFWWSIKRVINNLSKKQNMVYNYIPDSWEVVEYSLVEVKRVKANALSKNLLSEDDYKIKKMIK